MTDTLTTVAALGVILFGIIPFGADWWRGCQRIVSRLLTHAQNKA